MQAKIKVGWKHLFRPSEGCADDFEVAPRPGIRFRKRSESFRIGIRPGSEDPERSKVIDRALNRLRS